MKHTNIFEVHEMPEAEVSEEEEVEEVPEEAVAVAEPGEPEAPPAEGIWWCPKAPAVLSVLTQYWLLFAPLPPREGCEQHLAMLCLDEPVWACGRGWGWLANALS